MEQRFNRSLVSIALAAGALLAAPLHGQDPLTAQGKVGILVMAHGGLPEWDRAVAEAVEPLNARVPTVLALGMADPTTMQAGLDSLHAEGVGTVAVVRLFLSGESFLHDTEFYLGLRDDAPAMTMAMMMSHGAGQPHDMGPPKALRRSADILLEPHGLSELPLTATIVADRARRASADAAKESVIIIAHGMGDEGENQRVLDNMAPAVEALRAHGFAAVRAATLREDWPEARVLAEADIRDWVGKRLEAGDRVIVVPLRVFGFGGYAEVLSGLSHTPTEGLLPHPVVTEWIASSAGKLFCEREISNPLSACDSAPAP